MTEAPPRCSDGTLSTGHHGMSRPPSYHQARHECIPWPRCSPRVDARALPLRQPTTPPAPTCPLSVVSHPAAPPRDLSSERCRRLRAAHAHRVQLLIPHLRSSELTVWLPHEESRAQHGTCNSQHPNSLKRDASVPSQPVQQSSPRLTSRQRILNEEGDSALGHQFRQTPKPDSGCSHAARADASAYAQSPNASPIPKSRPNAPLKARPHTTSR